MTELHQPLNSTRQEVSRCLAFAVSGFYPDVPYWYCEAVRILANDPNVTYAPLKKRYGPHYEYAMKLFNRISKYTMLCEAYYAGLTKKLILEKDLTSERFTAYRHASLRLHQNDTLLYHTFGYYTLTEHLYDIFYTLFNSTTLRDMPIPHDAFNQARKQFQQFTLEPEEKKQQEKQDKIDDKTT